ncbi:MAG TPA: DUF1592 domain-containing protein, partial [Polyangiaceae bacterium]|nr:DUF1592 domain-containing protein [Polyangiaceae bacterium]
MIRAHSILTLLGAISSCLMACDGQIEGWSGAHTLSSSSGTNGAGSGNATMNPASNVSQETAKQRCTSSNVGPPMLRRLTQQEFQRTVSDIFPQIVSGWGGVKIGTDAVSSLGFSNDAATLVVGQQTAQEILDTAEDVASRVTDPSVLSTILPCSATSADATCAGQFIAQYGERLFRRPLTADETQTYTDYFNSVMGRSSFALGIKWTLVALFQSANAVYRSEIGTASGSSYALSQYEIATELSYSFGGSTPSSDLLAKAAAGALATPDARLAEARALLATEDGKEAVRELFREWSGYTVVQARAKNDQTDFTSVSADMV